MVIICPEFFGKFSLHMWLTQFVIDNQNHRSDPGYTLVG